MALKNDSASLTMPVAEHQALMLKLQTANEELRRARAALVRIGVEPLAYEEDQTRIAALQKALNLAVKKHGHEYNCSSVQGSERDCHCGWLEVKELLT